MKPTKNVALVLGLLLGIGVVYWWLNSRRIPTVRISHTLGKGQEVDIEWIELTP